MYLEIFLTDFAVFRVFLGISLDFAEIPEFRGSATARNIRSPDLLKGVLKGLRNIKTPRPRIVKNIRINIKIFS